MNKTIVFASLAIAGMTTSANAQVWAEVGDAGDGTVGSPAQFTGVTGAPLTTITGSLTGTADAYVIGIDPATFSATTEPTGPDTQLFLFFHTGGGVAGLGIAHNDDTPIGLPGGGVGFQSTLPVGNPLITGLAPGNYVLAVSGFNNDPTSGGAIIFPSSPFTAVHGPTGPGGGGPLTGWAGGGATGAYTIALTGATAKAIPGPASLALLGVAGLAARRRRR